jgi:CrcB protein
VGGSNPRTRRQGGFFVVWNNPRLAADADEEEKGHEQAGSADLMGLFTMGNAAVLYCWVAVGSALGGVARYWCTGVAARIFGETFPWGTLFVNVAGSLIIGVFATLTGPDGRIFAGTTTRQFVMIGMLGGFTTFSSFSLQTLNLANDGEWLQAGGNIVASVVLCLFAVWLGHLLAVSINALKWI